MIEALHVFLATAGYGVIHSLLASLPAKAIARKVFGTAADRYYRIFFNLAVAATFLPVLAVLLWNIGPVLWRWPGDTWILAAAGEAGAMLLLAAAFRQSDPAGFLGLRQLGGGASAGNLAVSGLYGIVRHPMYTAGIIFIWLLPVMTTGLLGLNLGLTLYILIGSELEERKLIAQYGDAYRSYRAKVARLIPFIL
jgi:protein-S-isoprenylcysteine O-methyltransferase Ste14